MQPPFPGMDPYLELPRLWAAVHAGVIAAMRDQLQAQIVPRYVAQITPYVALETLEVAAPRQRGLPDVGDNARAPLPAPDGGVAVATDAHTRYGRIEIRAVGDDTLVTVMELLSPANKRPSADGADAYERKRQTLLGAVHLLEIDLLRGGQRPRLARPVPVPLPAAPYFVVLSRANRYPAVDIWAIALPHPLPRVPVPLRPPDRDVVLDLNAVLHAVYERARYDVQVDYAAARPAARHCRVAGNPPARTRVTGIVGTRYSRTIKVAYTGGCGIIRAVKRSDCPRGSQR